jgi:GYD domain
MPKYLFQASYTVQGEEGVRSKGGTDRRDAVADTVKSVGGKLECLYFEFGERDVFSIVDLPDDEGRSRFPDRQCGRRSDGEDDRAAHTRTDRRGGEPRGQLPSAGTLSTQAAHEAGASRPLRLSQSGRDEHEHPWCAFLAAL